MNTTNTTQIASPEGSQDHCDDSAPVYSYRPYHSWLRVFDEPGHVTFHFPCDEFQVTADTRDIPVHDILSAVALDYDTQGKDGAFIRAVRDAYFPSLDGYVMEPRFSEYDFEDLAEFVDLLEAEAEQAPMVEALDSEDEEIASVEKGTNDAVDCDDTFPTMFARPPRVTSIPLPESSGIEGNVLEFETRYLLLLLKQHDWPQPSKDLVQIFYPEFEPEEFKTLESVESRWKREFMAWLQYLKEEGENPDTKEYDPMGQMKRHLSETYEFFYDTGLVEDIGNYDPDVDDVLVHYEIIREIVSNLPPGALKTAGPEVW